MAPCNSGQSEDWATLRISTNKSGKLPSLRYRILSGMAAGFFIILIGISLGIWIYARNAANHSYDRLLSGAALSILERTLVTPDGPTVDIPYSALEILGLAGRDRVFYRVFTAKGKTLTGTDKLPVPARYSPSPSPMFFDANYSGEKVRFLLQARFLAGAHYGNWVIVQIGQTRIARTAMAREMIISTIALFSFVTCIGLVFVWLGINRALAPLIGIEKQLRERDPTDFAPMEVTPPREVASLIRSINGFIQRHKNSLDNAQAFIADVAHQTRTSLGALQGILDGAERQSDIGEMRSKIAFADRQALRTVRLTNQLLSHAMLIHRADNTPHQEVNLLDVIRDSFGEIVPDYLKYDVEFSFDVSDEVGKGYFLKADTVALQEALRNLIDNAVKHCPAPLKINISIDIKNGYPMLIVDDNGPGIAPELHNIVLKRFSSLAQSSNGSGLGLSIVEAVAKNHGAIFKLEESPMGGLRAKLVFPKSIQSDLL